MTPNEERIEQIHMEAGEKFDVFAIRAADRNWYWHSWSDKAPSLEHGMRGMACGIDFVSEPMPTRLRPITKVCAECQRRRPDTAERAKEANELITAAQQRTAIHI